MIMTHFCIELNSDIRENLDNQIKLRLPDLGSILYSSRIFTIFNLDLHISHTTSSSSTADDYQCQCVHPCDLHLYSSSSSSVDNDDGDGISTDYRSDYWWFLTADNIINCADRQRKCSRQSTASSMRTTKRKKKRRRRRAKDDDERSSGANGIHHHRLVPSSIIDNRHHTTTISWLQLPLFLSFFISLARIVVAD
jgi:hypothetical protein